ncbi:MAG: PAS domain-containing sensor histidine kinase [Anaeromyxobacter sp. RBG_16_69_14]|nr:MAG: PAS domain-containing sensor histidine kinase [Anaeromyxobacter sp. RBG_16_69_14]
MTLRAKLILAQAPLALVLVLFGVASVTTISLLGQGPELILKDNYRSVLAAERMLQSLERLEAVALAHSTGRPAEGDPAEWRSRFEKELLAQEHNITEPGEDAATGRLRQRWSEYQHAFERIRSAPSREQLTYFFEALEPAYRRAQAAADEILALNQDAMASKAERSRRAAEQNRTLVVVATIGALTLGLILSLAMTARLLRPLGVLSQTVRRIGEGDLQARARVEGKDEIAALAGEFNTMADRLAEYRSSSLGELLQAQQASQAAIDSLPDPVLVLDVQGGILNLNRAAETMLRLGAGGVPPAVEALEPALRAVVERVRIHVLSGKGAYLPHGFEEAVRIESSEGDRHLLPRAPPLYSEQGGIIGVTIVLQDVTRLMRFDELKNDLVATVAHEFRTPLTSLRMAIHLCADELVGPLTDKQADLMAAARADCERLQGIVDDLLDLSRIQSGRMELKLEQIEVRTLLESGAAALRSAADDGRVELFVSPPAESVEVQGDRERIQLVLTNLLGNAVRHTRPGGRVEVGAFVAGSAVRFEVRDTGEGIAREHLDRIFEKSYRVPGARSGGVGLGLFISREIIQAHGGTMGVKSEPGRGSTFWFTIPAAERRPAAA